MEKCFITKLPSSVDNDGIVRLGEIPIYFDVDESPSDKSRSFTIYMPNQPERTLRIYNGYFTDNTLTQNLGTTLTLPATGLSNFSQRFYVSNTKCTVFVPIRYTDGFNVSGQINADSDFIKNTKYIDLEDIRYTNASSITFNNSSKLDWDIAKVAKYFPNITAFRVKSTNCFGDIKGLSNCTNLQYLFLDNTNVSGDISALRNCTNLGALQLINTNVSGDISALRNCTNLQYLFLNNTKVSGVVDNLAGLTKLAALGVTGTSLTGDMSKIPANINFISQMGRKINTNFTWTAKGRQNATLLAMEGNIPFDTVSMDNMLIDQATCTLTPGAWAKKFIAVSGNRTSASDAAVTAIQNMGVTITGVTKVS